MKSNWLVVAAFAILSGLFVRACFPKETTRIVQGPPAKPETIHVTNIEFRERIVIDTQRVFTTDTVQLIVETVIAETTFVPIGTPVAPRVYVTSVDAGTEVGDSTWIVGEVVSADSASMKFVPFAESYFTLGSIQALTTIGGTVRVNFTKFPAPHCSFGTKLSYTLGGGAAGLLIGVFAP